MELNIFMRELQSALVQRGIPEELAAKQVSNFRRTFTADDLSEIDAIQTSDEIDQLADSISAAIVKKMKAARAASQTSENRAVTPAKPTVKESAPAAKPAPKPVPKQEPRPKPKPTQDVRDLFEDDRDEYFEYSPESAATTKGIILFWVGLFITLPVTIAICAGIFLIFAALFIGLAALIVTGCVLLAGLVATGAVVSLVGVIFGITQLFSFVAAGIYEIGLGIMVAGIVLFAAILIYNLSVRFFPWVITQVGTFMGYIYGKLKDLFLYVRRECYKL